MEIFGSTQTYFQIFLTSFAHEMYPFVSEFIVNVSLMWPKDIRYKNSHMLSLLIYKNCLFPFLKWYFHTQLEAIF